MDKTVKDLSTRPLVGSSQGKISTPEYVYTSTDWVLLKQYHKTNYTYININTDAINTS